MSLIDVGKDAKRKGSVRPRDARRIDPVPEKLPPGAAKPQAKAVKPFGFSYEMGRFWRKPVSWCRYFQWFETERARDQSMQSFAKKMANREWYRNLRAERRA